MEKAYRHYKIPLENLLRHRNIVDTDGDAIAIPDGPWHVDHKPEIVPEDASTYTNQGLTLDTKGRPLHPNHEQLLARGAVTGKGDFWHWGPNHTVDAAVVALDNIALIRRKDTGQLALPGGFIDTDETSKIAVIRELEEEAGLILTPSKEPIYEGIVEDHRTTLHAWPYTTAYLFESDTLFHLEYGDDAVSAAWHPFEIVPELLEHTPTHRKIASRAIAQYGL